MEVEKLNKAANQIWTRFASKSSPELLRLEIDLYKKLLEFTQIGNSYYFVFSFRTFSFDMMGSDIESVLGYHPSEITMQFIMDKIHPDDQYWFLAFETKTVEFFSQLPFEKLMKYKVRYDYRFKKKNGEYVRILHQAALIEHDENGNALRTLCVHTDITYLKQDGKPVLSFIGMEDEPSYLDVNVGTLLIQSKDVLTRREKEVLSYLIEGRLSKEIAVILNISKQTVDTHRKNMLHKNNISNTGELIGKAIRYGWI